MIAIAGLPLAVFLALGVLGVLLAGAVAVVVAHLAWRRRGHAWAVGSILFAWLLWVAARFAAPAGLPQRLVVAPGAFEGAEIVFLLDEIAWTLGLALLTACLAVVLTAMVRFNPHSSRAWALSLSLASLGLLSIMAGNPMTLLMSWAALDAFETVALFWQVRQSDQREGIVASLTARLAGIAVLMLAAIIARSQGYALAFGSLSDQVPAGPLAAAGPYLLLAAGLRLGVLPLQTPVLQELPLRRGVGVMLRLTPAASSLVLLARGAALHAPLSETLAFLLMTLAGLAAFSSAMAWVTAADELNGRVFWIFGFASFAVGAAVHGDAAAVLAWSLALLCSGALIWLYSVRSQPLMRLVLLGMVGISALPFTPAWQGARLYAPFEGLNGWLLAPAQLLFLAAHALLLLGFVRHAVRPKPLTETFEPLAGVVYPLSLLLLPLAHLGLSWSVGVGWAVAHAAEMPLVAWLAGLVAAILGLGGWFSSRPGAWLLPDEASAAKRRRLLDGGLRWGGGFWGRLLSLSWMYQGAWALYRQVGRLLDGLRRILEGDGGLLWALLLAFMLFSLVTPALGE